MSTIAERVAAGVEWLDANVANWENVVSLNEFNIESTCDCVLGQVFAEEASEAGEYGGYDWAVIRANVMPREQAVALGFDQPMFAHDGDVSYDDHYAEWATLQDEWERVITDRKAARLDEQVGVLVDSAV